MEELADLGLNALFLGIKEGDGRLCWPSKVRPEAVRPEYLDFDLAEVFCEEARRVNIQPHAWMIDYMDHVAALSHPEWAALNKDGKPTSAETLRGRNYGATWMCPAQRPGYTDQWLVPLYAELAECYDFESIHHDYIRYPGDLAPDQYCFCDYCLEQIPKFAGFVNEAFPEEPFFHELYDRPYFEAHWEQSPRVLPANWALLPREVKSRFLLDGSFFAGGRHDLDYFFYLYRTHQINEFARLSHEAVKVANPKVKISGAIFKNPVHSGRFIGQDWRQFARWQEITIPMDYRDHFPGTFSQYLDLLEESIYRQKGWARESEALYIGIAINFLYKEELSARVFPAQKLTETLNRIHGTGVEGCVLFCTDQIREFQMQDAVRAAFR